MRKNPQLMALVFLLVFAWSVHAANTDKYLDDNLPWLDGFSLVVLNTHDIPSMNRALNVIQSFGGRIAILSPPSLMVGWIPFEVRDDLVRRAGIKDIYYTEVLPGEIDMSNEQSSMMVNYYNAVVRGEIQEKYRIRQQLAASRVDTMKMRPDVLDPPEFDEDAYIDNLKKNNLNLRVLKDRGLLLQKSGQYAEGNSDQMTGTVSVSIFFVESDGSGSDPDTYTWTQQHMQDYINGVNTGLAWWTSESYKYSGCWVAFMVRYYPGTDPRCQQWYEPVLHPSTEEAIWIGLVMSKFGYTSGTTATKVQAFNTWQRSTYGTDRAYSAFIAYNPPPANDRFTNGYAAAAYWGGPYAFLLYKSFNWDVEQVFAHETGHIFHTCDEYYEPGYGGCTSCGVCYNGVENGNCEYCGEGKPCVMKDNSLNLCEFTPGHVGWFLNPCAPAPLTPPTVYSSSPDGQNQGMDVVLNVAGENFMWGAFADLGPDIIVNSMTYVSPESIRANLTVLNSATPGMRNIIVYNRDLQSDTLFKSFRVINTSRHYMSPSGGNVYPYITPENASTSLAAAIAVANDGDSLLVASATINDIYVSINHEVKLYGAYVDDFTARDIENSKTVLHLSGNVTIGPTGPGDFHASLDGFIIENGRGVYQAVPHQAYYGGGIRIVGGRVTVANCEIRSNAASSGVTIGHGGGIFAMNSDVDIKNNYIWNNTADRGAGIYLYNSGGILADNRISYNQAASIETPSYAQGGGIYLENSPSLVLAGNTIEANTGAHDGGGICVSNSGPVTISGGTITYNQVQWGGGGINAIKSNLVLDSVIFARNTSSLFGGGMSLSDSSGAVLENCRFLWNSALVGGSIYANGGNCNANHSLYVGSSGSNGGCVYLMDLLGGGFIGNTIDRTDAGGTGGCVMMVNTDIAVFNNIITNTNGYGVNCGGARVPAPEHNDVWNNSLGNYNGCTPGDGSISQDPLYEDTSAVDYHLVVNSPAIDAGDTLDTYNDPDGSRGDLGWYGSHDVAMEQPSYPKNLTRMINSGNTKLIWKKNPESDIRYYAVYRDTAAGFKPSADCFVQFVPAADTSYSELFDDGMYYKISAVDSAGYGSGYSNEVGPETTEVPETPSAYKFALYQNVPNPFNPVTAIRYEIDKRSPVTLTIYNVEGRLVKRLVREVKDRGVYSVLWYGRNESGSIVSSGIYFYKLVAGGRVESKKMVLLK
jgi:hypothetical protein